MKAGSVAPADAPRDRISRRRVPLIERGWVAALVYCAVTLLMTWPLARGLSRDVAADLGDPLYYMWAIAWDCRQILAMVGGDVGRISTFFDANIFYPEPLGLAYSDHMIPQAIQASSSRSAISPRATANRKTS